MLLDSVTAWATFEINQQNGIPSGIAPMWLLPRVRRRSVKDYCSVSDQKVRRAP